MIHVDIDKRAGQALQAIEDGQAAIVPVLDAALGIEQKRDKLCEYLMQMREYMPPEHVRFIEAGEVGPSIREFVQQSGRSSTREIFNDCVELGTDFCALHLEYAGTYIHAQAQKQASNLSAVGTGGTPFMVYLRKRRDETRHQAIST